MVRTQEIITYIDSLLQPQLYKDYCHNGLQLAGVDTVKHIVTGVSCNLGLIEAAIDLKSTMLLTHHGVFWRNDPNYLTGLRFTRVQKLINAGINVVSYHLPLDVNKEFGNNACLAKQLQAQDLQQHTAAGVSDLLWTGKIAQSTASTLADDLGQMLQQDVRYIGCSGDKPITKVAWCSGAGQDFLEQAAELGVDAYISGEVSERTYHSACDLGICYIIAGHHATERGGIQELGNRVSKHFALEHTFIDISNPI